MSAKFRCLLNLFLTQGLHLLRGSKGVQDKWERLYSDLFLNDVFLSYKEEHYKAGSSRKVRDKYESILEKISKNIDKGNQSGKSGDLCERFILFSKLRRHHYNYLFTIRFKLVKQIQEEMDLTNSADLKRKLIKHSDGKKELIVL